MNVAWLWITCWFLPLLAPAETLAQAQCCFAAGDYRGAAALYDRLSLVNTRSRCFYGNQANLHFLSGDFPRAILGYRRTCRAAGCSSDINANLEDAWRHVGNVPGVTAWRLGLRAPLWLVGRIPKLVGAFLIWSLGALLAQFIFFRRFTWRMIFCITLLAILVVLLWIDREYSAQHPFLVIALDGVILRQGNGESYAAKMASGIAIRLHAGTEGRLRGERPNGWVQIELPDGLIGWVQRHEVLIDE